MTYFPEFSIKSADSPSIDSFGKWRISEPFTLFDSKLIFTSGGLFWDFSGSAGGFYEYSQSEASIYLKTTTTQGSHAVRQTKQRFNYQPGKAQSIAMTGILNPQVGYVKNVGYFDANNGLFFQSSGSNVYVVKRNNGVDTKVSQSAWNLDKLDGTGKSEIDLDYSKAQIFAIDFEWLGVGRVRFGHYYGGLPVYCHEFSHKNELDGPYMQTPNLPLRYEIRNQAGGTVGQLKEICATVISEGGVDPEGIAFSIDSGQLARSITAAVTGSVVAVRLKSGWEGATVQLNAISLMSPTEGNTTYWAIYHNPFTSSAFTWEDIPNTPLQRATNVASVNVRPGAGTVRLDSGYIYAAIGQGGSDPGTDLNTDTAGLLRLGSRINGTRDIIVLGVSPTITATYKGSIKFTTLR